MLPDNVVPAGAIAEETADVSAVRAFGRRKGGDPAGNNHYEHASVLQGREREYK